MKKYAHRLFVMLLTPNQVDDEGHPIRDTFEKWTEREERAFQAFCNDPYKGSTRLALAIQVLNEQRKPRRGSRYDVTNEANRRFAYRSVLEGKVNI